MSESEEGCVEMAESDVWWPTKAESARTRVEDALRKLGILENAKDMDADVAFCAEDSSEQIVAIYVPKANAILQIAFEWTWQQQYAARILFEQSGCREPESCWENNSQITRRPWLIWVNAEDGRFEPIGSDGKADSCNDTMLAFCMYCGEPFFIVDDGSYACPHCGGHDGNGHLRETQSSVFEVLEEDCSEPIYARTKRAAVWCSRREGAPYVSDYLWTLRLTDGLLGGYWERHVCPYFAEQGKGGILEKARPTIEDGWGIIVIEFPPEAEVEYRRAIAEIGAAEIAKALGAIISCSDTPIMLQLGTGEVSA